MSDILIRGMEMPKNCWSCPFRRFLDDEDECLAKRIWIKREKGEKIPPVCPLIELPPHGRVIDADEFLKRAIGTKCFRGDYALMLEELVGESTTIIPAEDGE